MCCVADPKYFVGKVVSPSYPRQECGTYWGYRVRFAHSLGAIFTESPFEVSGNICNSQIHVRCMQRVDMI